MVAHVDLLAKSEQARQRPEVLDYGVCRRRPDRLGKDERNSKVEDYGGVGFLLAKDEQVFCWQRTNRLGKVERRFNVEDCGRCGWLSVGEERASQLAKVDKSTKSVVG